MKEKLSAFVRTKLIESYGSVPKACHCLLSINYERLKKSLQRNSFDPDFLTEMFPDISLQDLREQYEFRVGRISKNRTVDDRLRIMVNARSIISADHWVLLEANHLLRERIKNLIIIECERARLFFSSE